MKWHTVFFWTSLLLLLLASAGASYVRFFVNSDYLVTYSTECNPDESSCYLGCDDDACENPSFYMYIERPAQDLNDMCSQEDIASCLARLNCAATPGKQCVEMFCDSATEDCSTSQINE